METDLHWSDSEAWYEGNLSTMLRCVDLSRALVDTSGPARNTLMQLKVTALTSPRLCVSDKVHMGKGDTGVATHQASLLESATTPFQEELSTWIQKSTGSSELSPERLAEAMDSGKVMNRGGRH